MFCFEFFWRLSDAGAVPLMIGGNCWGQTCGLVLCRVNHGYGAGCRSGDVAGGAHFDSQLTEREAPRERGEEGNASGYH